ncbi:colicin E1 family microcin immunity protein [Providencia rettgeri]
MSKKYYMKNMGWGLFGCALFLWLCRNESTQNYILISTFLIASALLYPFSKKAIEVVALTFTNEKFWNTGFFANTALKSGIYAIYYMFCFIFAIPIGLIFIIFLSSKKSRI